jgi:hypothetical protein
MSLALGQSPAQAPLTLSSAHWAVCGWQLHAPVRGSTRQVSPGIGHWPLHMPAASSEQGLGGSVVVVVVVVVVVGGSPLMAGVQIFLATNFCRLRDPN